ncbi:MAG TPA: hypothetical protein ENJ95_07440 [Bacteroidetes bacterium]|nr:hypothetical protein [Bacteroidota bacterium]
MKNYFPFIFSNAQKTNSQFAFIKLLKFCKCGRQKKGIVFPALFISFLFIFGCRSYMARPYDFPRPVDTTDKAIKLQEKKIYALAEQGVYAGNLFDGARLNNFEHVGNNTFRATISPENEPINPSAYYAFKIWATDKKNINLELNYTQGYHRYAPKISRDGKTWELLDSNKVELAQDSASAFLSLDISADTLWLAAQEIHNSTHVRQWCEAKAKQPGVHFSSIGKSKLGKGFLLLDINIGDARKKDIIVVLSRQHPPEVTGYLAMQAFVDEILADNILSNNFRKKYRLLVFPLMNPDGVDLGHWRHNAGGVDLNRDWAYYHQPENRQVADFIVKTVRQNKSDLILGLDFHSTFYDVYYTNNKAPEQIPNFKDYWITGIKNTIKEEAAERPSNVGAPVSKAWFLTQFGAEGITYEIGDSTPRDFIKKKGKISAVEMMELLVFRGE